MMKQATAEHILVAIRKDKMFRKVKAHTRWCKTCENQGVALVDMHHLPRIVDFPKTGRVETCFYLDWCLDCQDSKGKKGAASSSGHKTYW